jgi:hypothetical protein
VPLSGPRPSGFDEGKHMGLGRMIFTLDALVVAKKKYTTWGPLVRHLEIVRCIEMGQRARQDGQVLGARVISR